MDRRNFLYLSGAAAAGLTLPASISQALAQAPAPAAAASGKWTIYEVTHRVEVVKPSGLTRIWLPTPLTDDTQYHKSLGSSWNAEGGTAAFSEDGKYGAGIVSAEFPAGTRPALTMTSRFATRDVAVDLSKTGRVPAEDRAELRKYTAATELMPIDGIVKKTSSEIVRGKRGDLEKARAIYEWVVDNTARDAKTRGCGTGDIKFMLENNALSGKFNRVVTHIYL